MLGIESIRDGEEAWGAVVFGMLYTFEMDAAGRARFPWATEGIQKIFEVQPAQVADDASLVLSRIHADDLQRVKSQILASRDSLSPWRSEYRVELPKAGLRWLRGEALPERSDGGATLWRGHIVDITDLKVSEGRWRDTAKLLTMVADASPKALFVATESKEGSIPMALPFVSQGVAEVLGVDPKDAMEDARSVWRLFDPEMRQRGLSAFARAKADGKAEEVLDFTDAKGRVKAVKMGIEWIGAQAGKPAWVGYASELGGGGFAEQAWARLSASMEGRIGKDFLEGFAPALADACEAQSCQSHWFEDNLSVGSDPFAAPIAWGVREAKVAIVEPGGRPIGSVELSWGGEAPKELSTMLTRAAALVRVHWERARSDAELEHGLDSAKKDLVRAANMAWMGNLVGGVAHDLSSPLANGALEVEVIRSRAQKLEAMLAADKVTKSGLQSLAKGLAEIADTALGEIDKARGLLDAFKKIANEQSRAGASRHELGKLLLDMRASLNPTLRRRGVDLTWIQAGPEIWATLDVAETFNWLAKCATSAAGERTGSFGPPASVTVRARCKAGRAIVEVGFREAEHGRLAARLGEPLSEAADGQWLASREVGPGECAWEEL